MTELVILALGALAAFFTATSALLIAYRTLRMTKAATQETAQQLHGLHTEINSKMTLLMELIRTTAFREGQEFERNITHEPPPEPPGDRGDRS